MINPQMPNMPGAGVVTDTLDFVKNLWGSMGVPGAATMATPTLSVDDLDKKITDLKAVEAWLNVNTAMVRGTIQALEVQRGTIATIKAMSEAMAQAMAQPAGADKAPFGSAFFGQGKPASDSGGAQQAASSDTAAGARAETGSGTAADGAAAGAQPGAAFTSAAAWWNVLQDQFKQAVSTAMSPDAASKFTQAATDAANASSELSKSMAQTMSGTAMKAAAPEESASKKPSGKQAAKPRNGKPKQQDE